MLNKFLEEIVILLVGKYAEGVVPLLNTSRYVNEFDIAKRLDITINQTRNILYKISDHGLVSSIRKKDKKKGWYTYFWKFEILKCLEFLKDLLKKRKKELEKELVERKSKIFYNCTLCTSEYGEDQAILMNFTCDECGEIFTTKDNSKVLRDLNRIVSKIKEKLNFVEDEIDKEKIKLGKKKMLRLKKEEKEKQLKKEEAKLRRAEKKKKDLSLKEKEKKKKTKSPRKDSSNTKLKNKKKTIKTILKKKVSQKIVKKKNIKKKILKKKGSKKNKE